MHKRGYPVDSGTGDIQVFEILREVAQPLIVEWQPDAIDIAAGFDAHRKDDMSGLCFSSAGYGKMGEIIHRWSKTYADGKVLSLLEGGYEVDLIWRVA